jgi:type IV secretion system protein VirB6
MEELVEMIGGLVPVTFLINLIGALEVAQTAMSYYAAHVVGAIDQFVATCLTIYVILYGFAMMNGHVKDVSHDAFIRLFKIAIVLTLSRNLAYYNNEVAQLFWNMPEQLIQWLTPATVMSMIASMLPAGSPTTSTDMSILLISTVMSFTVSIMHSGLEASSAAGQTDAAVFASAMGVGVAGASFSAVVAGILLVAKISLSVLLALGPFFLVSILFEKTKAYFDGWLSQVLNFILVILLLTLTIYLLFPILIITVASYYAVSLATGALSLRESVELITLLGIFLAVIKQVPTTAAAVVRGYAVGAAQERNVGSSAGQSNQGGGKNASQAHAEMNAKQR